MKCIECGANALEDSQFCYWHSDTIPQAKKDEARRMGGRNSKKVPLNLDIDDYLPIKTPEDLNRFYNALLKCCAEEYREDLSGFVRAAVKITPKLSELLAFQSLAALDEKIAQLEARQTQKMLPYRVNGHVDTGEFTTED